TLEQALAHPTWRMGVKNTIDSATMMNKGLEVIEASRLFGFPGKRIDVLVHPQSVAHGMVVFADGNVKAQLAAPDMRLPIGYALGYPDRLPTDPTVRSEQPDALTAIGGARNAETLRYDFERPDLDRFPCLGLAYAALEAGGTMPAVLSAANEIAVRAFVRGELGFADIPRVIANVMKKTAPANVSLDAVREADATARERAGSAVGAFRQRTEV
ncbi:MAG: 1-deoxy-D-xylulose-5-phosphate reductoisomerase, partial [Candidatus Eremiobacteraeota bacterium]|nr:1-deoxy-D-xylulose-5-phosphate reductoisomerase [Candidatus Eremiobacteraeota bacterium]